MYTQTKKLLGIIFGGVRSLSKVRNESLLNFSLSKVVFGGSSRRAYFVLICVVILEVFCCYYLSYCHLGCLCLSSKMLAAYER